MVMLESALPAHLELSPETPSAGRTVRAVDRLRGFAVAVKQARGYRQIEALEHEWRLLHRLWGGPFQVPVEFRRLAPDHAYLTTEWLDGHTLHGPPVLTSAEQLLPAIGVALDGLARLHRSGFVHGDIRPQNLLVCTGATAPRAVWLDLEFARAYRTLEAGFEVVPGWNAGFEASGGKHSPRTDLQALGESLRAARAALSGQSDPATGCLNAFIDDLRDPYRIARFKDASDALRHLCSLLVEAGAEVDVTAPAPEPGMSITHRRAAHEWDELLHRWLADVRTHVVQVVGPPGCGKTAFLRQALCALALDGHVVLDLVSPGRSGEPTAANGQETGALSDYLASGTKPPALMMDQSTWLTVRPQCESMAPTGSLLIVEVREGDEISDTGSESRGTECWRFPVFSPREWIRWIAAST